MENLKVLPLFLLLTTIVVFVCATVFWVVDKYTNNYTVSVVACAITSFLVFAYCLLENGHLPTSLMLMTICQCIFWFDCAWIAWGLLVIFAIWVVLADSWSLWGHWDTYFSLSTVSGFMLCPYLGAVLVGADVVFSTLQGCVLLALHVYSLWNICGDQREL